MPNIKFNYRYRCSGNYKKFISIVFLNPDNIELQVLEKLILSKLIYGEYFYAADWKLPEIFTDIVEFRVDPTWHEFVNIDFTDEAANTTIRLREFMEIVEKTRPIF